MKKAIAMKCTQEQWDSIKDKITLPITDDEFNLKRYPWLTNTYDNKTGIGTCLAANNFSNREIHEKFNAKIFLDACGIETDAYKITKEQVLELSKMNCVIKEKFCDLFPDAFKKELEVGKWYKSLEHPKQLIFLVDFKDVQHIKGYGFDTRGNWEKDNNHFSWGLPSDGDFTEAPPQEVEAALISEAKKRGFKEGVVCNNSFVWNDNKYKDNVFEKGCFEFKDNKLNWNSSNDEWYTIFSDGKWATIIHPEKTTLEQIEKELGRKIELI